jgi:hypothetical protein
VAQDVRPDDLKVAIQSVEPTADKKVEVAVRLSNTASRALHYIADVRAVRYDPATRVLTLSLSDEGREIIPGAIRKLPVIRHVDPGTEAEIRLVIPDRVIKLSRSVSPGELAFDKYEFGDMQEVVVEVGWSEVPFYKDTRRRAKADVRQLPTTQWEQHKTRALMRLGEKGPSRNI